MTQPPRRDTARALLFDGDGHLLLIKRTRPGMPSYLVTPGGAIEPGEDSVLAVQRECAEEMGAVVSVGPAVLVSPPDPRGSVTIHLALVDFFDLSLRTGHELTEPERGAYETVSLAWDDAGALVRLRPEEIQHALATHGEMWFGWVTAALAQSAPPRVVPDV